MGYRTIDVRPISGALGAEIMGADLSVELSERAFAEIHRAFLEHLVIFIRDQDLSSERQKAFARRFGPLIIDPFVRSPEGEPEVMEVVKERSERKNFGNVWHTDATFLERPPLGSFLYAIEVPPYGGDTMFANQYLAYESLSEGMRRLLDGLKAVHGARSYNDEIDRGSYTDARAMKLRFDDVMRRAAGQEVVHPVVRTHPETGRRALYVHPAYVLRFEGWSEAESRPLLEFLYAHSTRPEFTCRYRWMKGTLALWDNRCALHYPINDYHGFRRVMRRITAEGDRPI